MVNKGGSMLEDSGLRNIIDIVNIMATVMILAFSTTKGMVYGFITYVFLGGGLYNIYFIKELWSELNMQIRVKLILLSMGFICVGIGLIALK